ncbi:hypothetical protein VVD49_00670 [Uliginosibacterium sp. H3]|uniref:Uncharacterized protein n=1 Tax=Uliginosibacterium silvisoli TaxID=3114758 RepID=A0ABU6JY39_9RHOO|nr:hypothetical protein [Uliginosibacterium sp. H3]
MFDVEIFYKTELGRMAVSDRSYGLQQRMRAALILIDGKTPWVTLQSMLKPLGDPADIVENLSQLGLLESDHQLPPMPVIQPGTAVFSMPASTGPMSTNAASR